MCSPGGVVCYANELKTRCSGVPAAMIAAHGAVSEPVACAMALGALQALGVDLAVAVTGIAGPTGGTEAKPVGTIWFAVARDGRATAHRSVFGGDRREIRARAAQGALLLLYRNLPPATDDQRDATDRRATSSSPRVPSDFSISFRYRP